MFIDDSFSKHVKEHELAAVKFSSIPNKIFVKLTTQMEMLLQGHISQKYFTLIYKMHVKILTRLCSQRR